MFITLSLIMLVSCSVYSMDNSPRKEEQNWISKKELTRTLGYQAAHTLAMVASTKPDEIKKLKLPKGAFLKATKAIYAKSLDEIFSQEQWDALYENRSLHIIDKYRTDSVSTWHLVDPKQEKTEQNKKRAKREYCYATPKNKRNVVPLKYNKMYDIFIIQETDLTSPFKSTDKDSVAFQYINIASEKPIDIRHEKNAKNFTITWKNGANKDESQTWRAKRAIKESVCLDDYLKTEFCKNIKNINIYTIVLSNQNHNNTYNCTVSINDIFVKYGIPQAELLNLSSRAGEENADNLMIALIQQYVLPSQIESLKKDVQLVHEKMGIHSEADTEEVKNKSSHETCTNLKDSLTLSHIDILNKYQ